MMKFPIYGKIKNVPNHQPDVDVSNEYDPDLLHIDAENPPFVDRVCWEHAGFSVSSSLQNLLGFDALSKLPNKIHQG